MYGTPLSLYSGKVRSYLIKAGLDYHEKTIADSRFRQKIAPLAGKMTIPIVELPDGQVIRDGTRIIDHFESQTGGRFSPATPRQRILSRLFDVIGAEGLLRPAMHYRWNFPEKNLDFLTFHFGTNIPPDMDRQAMAEKQMDRMRNAGVMFGATPERFKLIESLYGILLDRMNDHFSKSPYLLGSRPCMGDFGMIAPLYAHLGRDPMPLSLMQARAVRAFRWVERMNRPEPDIGEFDEMVADQYLPDDDVPESLRSLLNHIAIDFMPETIAAAEAINAWLEAEKPETGAVVERAVGMCQFEVQGEEITAIAQPYRFFLLRRVTDEYQAMTAEQQQSVDELLSDCGMQGLLNIQLSRDIEFENNIEVWR
jgi:glutathione S-transferase